VGDVDGGGVEALDDVAHGGQHFHLGGHVQRRRRLVEDDQVGPGRHGHGGHGALQLTTGHLVRIALADMVGVGQLQRGEQLTGVRLGGVLGREAMIATVASTHWSISRWAGLNDAAALCAT
jgi:hypothetical protein